MREQQSLIRNRQSLTRKQQNSTRERPLSEAVATFHKRKLRQLEPLTLEHTKRGPQKHAAFFAAINARDGQLPDDLSITPSVPKKAPISTTPNLRKVLSLGFPHPEPDVSRLSLALITRWGDLRDIRQRAQDAAPSPLPSVLPRNFACSYGLIIAAASNSTTPNLWQTSNFVVDPHTNECL